MLRIFYPPTGTIHYSPSDYFVTITTINNQKIFQIHTHAHYTGESAEGGVERDSGAGSWGTIKEHLAPE